MGARLALALCAGVGLAACGAEDERDVEVADRPSRIVSLDYCADQYVLKLANRKDILALSPEAEAGFSYMRDAAAGLPTVRPVAEDVLILKPDLVVRSYGGGPNAEAFFERAGIRVLQVGWTETLDGEGAGSIPSVIRQMADGLGQPVRGRALAERFEARLAALHREPGADEPSALYMTPYGATTGPGSLVHEMLVAAGLRNFEDRPGWHALPLERLAYERPDTVAAAFFGDPTDYTDAWSAARHPVARKQLARDSTVVLEGAWTACGGWFVLDAVEALSHASAGEGGVR